MDNQQYLADILPKLREAMPYKWRVHSYNKEVTSATCVAYIDSREVMDRLDSVCIYGWERSHTAIKDNIYATVRIIMPDGTSMSRMDCGTESSTEKEKGESSDSFKRAAVNWGIGRFLYDLKIQKLAAKANGDFKDCIDDSGKKIWDLTKHINALIAKGGKESDSQPEPKAPSNLTVGDVEFKQLNTLLDETATDKKAFCDHFKVTSVAALPMAEYAKACAMLNKKLKDKKS